MRTHCQTASLEQVKFPLFSPIFNHFPLNFIREFQELRKMDKEQRQKQQQKPNKKRNLSSPGPFKSPHDPANNAAPIRITFDVTALHELSSQDIDSQQIDFITAQMDVAKGVYEKRLQVPNKFIHLIFI